MKIADIFWLNAIVDKLASKHGVSTDEVEDVVLGRVRFRYVRKGNRPGEDVYMALGQTFEGRYLTVLFIHKLNGVALILSVRDMSAKERRSYGRK